MRSGFPDDYNAAPRSVVTVPLDWDVIDPRMRKIFDKLDKLDYRRFPNMLEPFRDAARLQHTLAAQPYKVRQDVINRGVDTSEKVKSPVGILVTIAANSFWEWQRSNEGRDIHSGTWRCRIGLCEQINTVNWDVCKECGAIRR